MNLYTALRSLPRHYVYSVRGLIGATGLLGKLNRPIFIVGAPNSGTRALGQAVACSPDIRDQSEARVLWDKDFHERRNDTLKTADDVRTQDILRLRGNFAYYQWRSGKPTVLNRHPENSLRIHFIKKVFPTAKIIHIVRDGRAVVCSNYRAAMLHRERLAHPFGAYIRPPGWRDRLDWPLLDQLAYMWKEVALYASREGKKYGDDFLEVFYEDLPERSTEIVAGIWRWAGLAIADEFLAALPKFENRNHKWRAELTAAQVDTVERIAAEGLRYFGYVRSDKYVDLPSSAKI